MSIIASLHSGGKEEFQNKRIAKILLSTKEFKKAIFLQGQPNIGRVKEVLNLS